jgi:hypothetical protein
MKKLIVLTMFSLVFFSCANDCKDVNGTFSEITTGLRYSFASAYIFSGNEVRLTMISKKGSQDYKSDGSDVGNFKIDNEKVIMNFGGSDVILIINRNADGCIQSLSSTNTTYEKR